MANDTVFQVIRDAIVNAKLDPARAGAPSASREPPPQHAEADQYARAVLVALDHNGFKIVQTRDDPDVD